MKINLLTPSAWEIIANDASRQCVTPSVSVIISLYNFARYIGDCLDSVLASRAENLPGGFEVIVVDDSSTDDSAKMVETFLAENSLPLRLVKKNVNTGVADTRNIGLLLARAPFIFMLDADNKIRPN